MIVGTDFDGADFTGARFWGGRYERTSSDPHSDRPTFIEKPNPIWFDCSFRGACFTAADLSAALGGEGLGCFHDLDRLTLFADDLVPHVLRCEGVLVAAPALARRIDSEELIPASAAEEIELRYRPRLSFEADASIEWEPKGPGTGMQQIALGDLPTLRPEDIADAVLYAANAPEHVDIFNLVLMPTVQRYPGYMERD